MPARNRNGSTRNCLAALCIAMVVCFMPLSIHATKSLPVTFSIKKKIYHSNQACTVLHSRTEKQLNPKLNFSFVFKCDAILRNHGHLSRPYLLTNPYCLPKMHKIRFYQSLSLDECKWLGCCSSPLPDADCRKVIVRPFRPCSCCSA